MWGSEAEGTLEESLCLVWLSRPGLCASASASQVGTTSIVGIVTHPMGTAGLGRQGTGHVLCPTKPGCPG